MYNVDPNNNKKQIPKGRPKTAYGKVTTPAEETIQNRPNHILVNMNGTYAFSKKGKKKKRKKNIEKQTGYKFVDEAISKDDIRQIKKQIRKEVSDILRDIWIKRNSWGGK